jgi:hypothetical protein
MSEAPIYSNFVSCRVEVGFADAAEAMERLAGGPVAAGRARLVVKRASGGPGDRVSLAAVLHTRRALVPRMAVEVVLSPWSAGRTEIGIRPLGRLGSPGSVRSRRFLAAAWAVLPELATAVESGRPVVTTARPEVPAAV